MRVSTPASLRTNISEVQTWLAPAKLNLFLRILSRRPDGYHNLQTVFQLLDYGDELVFTESESGEIERSYDFVAYDSDLCVRAIRLLESELGVKLPVHIDLKKKLPIGGGVGGGSSDAATTLMAVNHLWQLGINRQRMMQLGLQLGADVPVFIHGQSAWAEGVGEKLTTILLPETTYLVVTPDVSVSTAEIFANKCLTRDQDAITIPAFRTGEAINELEPIVRKCYPLVDDTFRWLENFGAPVMTGTGASVFLTVDSREKGWKIAAECPTFASCFVARGVQQHPLNNGVWPSG
ncbi:MAG: 4-(cytidine 5'-diphospho)-2-C-methyl-D-erythritol kinase [Arenicella sp.]